MNRSLFAVLLVILGTLLLVWYFYARQTDVLSPEPPVAAVADPPSAQPPAGPVTPRHPVVPPEPTAGPTAPTAPVYPDRLEQADVYLQEQLPQLIDNPRLLQLLTLNHFIEKLVLIIDKLPETEIPRPHLPITPPKPGFLTTRGSYGELVISGRNAARYSRYVQLAEVLPDATLLRLYRGLYPLFQQAYVDLGHPDGYFNDRLIAVIEHLLETPEVQGPIALVPHIGRFKYADETLESRSAGQKTLLRMGNDNAARIKAKLAGLHRQLVGNQ